MTLLFDALPDVKRPLRDLPSSALPRSEWRPPSGPLDLTGVKRIGLDVERKDPRINELGPGTFRGDAKIVGVSIATEDGRKRYFPIAHEGGGNCDWDVVGWLKRDLERYDGEIVGAKLSYDLESVMYEYGLTLPNVRAFHDVQIAETVIDEWRLRYSLEVLAWDYLKRGKAQDRLRRIAELRGWKTDAELKTNLYRMSGLDVGEYGEDDADLPLRILPLQLKKLEEDDQLHIYDLERRLIPVNVGMRMRGVRVATTDRLEEVRAVLAAERERWTHEVRRLLGKTADINNSESLGPFLKDRGLIVPRTKASKTFPQGKWSVAKEFLEKNKGDAAVNAIAAARRIGTLISLTIDSLLTHRTADGRVHCEWNSMKGEDENGNLRGTIARYSCTNPNLQQVPARESEFDELIDILDDSGKKVDLPALIRGLYLPEDGEDFESDDESQIEYRLLVDCAVGKGAEEARERYRTDPKTDYHKFAAELLKVDPEDNKRRKRVKNVNFAYGYGAQAPRLAQTFNCPVPEAEEFLRTYNREMPFVKATFDRAAESAARHGIVYTVLRRKARFPRWEPVGNRRTRDGYVPALPLERAKLEYPNRQLVRADTYKALNRKLQGSGADVLKKAMVDAHEAGVTRVLGMYLMTVHDELGNSVPRTREGQEAAAELRRTMETCVKLPGGVPLMVKSERGPSWGAVKEWR